jgi:hypothetical protein
MFKKVHFREQVANSRLGRMAKNGWYRFAVGEKNQRKSPRFDCMIPVEIHVDTPGQISIINAVAKNISTGGMLIMCAAALNDMTSCHLSFRMPEWFPGAKRTCDVMAYAHVRHANPAAQFFGLSFDSPL